MKNLNHKQFVQKLVMYISLSENRKRKLFYNLYDSNSGFLKSTNLIGFNQESFDPPGDIFKNNFCRYYHFTNGDNFKLYKKYPYCVLKNDYKQWLKDLKRLNK